MDATRPAPDPESRPELWQSVERLRDRLLALNLNSRSVRLIRCTRTTALDLERLAELEAPGFRRVLKALGRKSSGSLALQGRVPRSGPARQLATDLGRLAERARDHWLQTGSDDLAVGWPFLEGRLGEGPWLRAPLLLYPVRLAQRGIGSGRWSLELAGPPELNESLAGLLRRQGCTGLSLDALLEGDEDHVLACDAGTFLDLGRHLARLGLPLCGRPAELPGLEPLAERSRAEREAFPPDELELRHQLVLGLFPHAGTGVLLDYDRLLEQRPPAGELGLAAELLGHVPPAGAPAAPDEVPDAAGPLDGLRRWLVLDSDDSQDAVLVRLGERSRGGLVVQGPPGTGKSQLIANLLAAGLAEGWRTLLVCQKRAALDVVAARLEALGLREPAALVHDPQGERSALCSSIASTLRSAQAEVQALDSWQRERLRSASSSAELALAPGHAAAEARVRNRFREAQQAFERLTRRDARPSLAELQQRALDDDGRPLPELDALADETGEAEALALLPRLERLAAETVPLAEPHPLARRSDWSSLDADRLAAAFRALEAWRGALDALRDQTAGLTPAEALAQAPLFDEVRGLIDLLGAPDPAERQRFLRHWIWTGGQLEAPETARLVELLAEAQATLQPVPSELLGQEPETLERWDRELELLARLRTRWYRVFQRDFWRLRGRSRELLRLAPGLSRALVPAQGLDAALALLCRQARAWQEFVRRLPAEHPVLELAFGGRLEDIERPLERLRRLREHVRSVHRLHEVLGSRGGVYAALPFGEDGSGAALLDAALADARRAERFAALRAATAEAAALLDPGLASWLGQRLEAAGRGEIEQALAAVDELLAVRADAAEALRLDRLLAGEPAWVRRFLRRWRPAEPGASSLEADVRTSLERAWLRRALGASGRRMLEAPLVDGDGLDALAGDLALVRRDMAGALHALWRRRLHGALLDATPGSGARMRQLAHDAASRSRLASLRRLSTKHWTDALSVVRPIWMCTPEAAATIFELGPDVFDLVVFDEASQCPVESALPVLLRGRRAVVAGDDQQMPPAHFFLAQDDPSEETDEPVTGGSSLLEQARRIWPGTTLRWHYRSRHEALVAFSNRAFYGGRLVTAPPAAGAGRSDFDGLHWHRVEGLWSEQTNQVEAETVVDLVGRLLAAGPEPPSVGVVTFNLPQAELVSERLEARAASDASLRRLLERDRKRQAIDQLFVRNLENVQGDERDVIVFSIGYGPAEPEGRVLARFGPLGLEGGGRRLNVAVTRARRGVHVICSFDPDALDVSGTLHSGPKLLAVYLAYVRAAAAGQAHEVARLLERAAELGGEGGVTAQFAAPRPDGLLGLRVRTELGAELEKRGLRVERDVGLGPLRLDLAVGVPGPLGERLGVDCTGFLRLRDPFARDVVLRSFWRRLGWHVLRVTPGEWLEQRGEVLSRIERLAQGPAGGPLG